MPQLSCTETGSGAGCPVSLSSTRPLTYIGVCTCGDCPIGCWPGAVVVLPPEEPDGLEPVDPPPFWPHEGTAVTKRRNPAMEEQANKCVEERFIGRLTGGETSCHSSIRPRTSIR